LSTQKADRHLGFGTRLQKGLFAAVKQVFLGRYVLFQGESTQRKIAGITENGQQHIDVAGKNG